MSWSKRPSEMGPTSSRSRRPWRIISWPAANGMTGSSATPMATVAPSGTNRSTASAIDWTFTCLLRDRVQVRAVVALELGHRVAAELLQHRLGQREGDDGLPDHARGGDDADVAALVVRLGLCFRVEVDRWHRLFHGRDRLDRDPQVDRLAVGHASGQPAGPVRQVAEATFLVVDLVVELGAAPARAVEACAELHTLDRVDGEDSL